LSNGYYWVAISNRLGDSDALRALRARFKWIGEIYAVRVICSASRADKDGFLMITDILRPHRITSPARQTGVTKPITASASIETTQMLPIPPFLCRK